ncbi:MAG: hypothetical protein GWQ08_00090 [Verrucomicrobiaceae bacterium]|nr:hypothetical protein [Verrucomicrobiaceae bacterium]
MSISSGAGSFVFDQFPDGEHAPLTVHYYWPPSVDENARIVFVMHGLLRDGERYRDRWQDHANEHGFLLIAPEFDREFYPADADYNLAGIVNDEANNDFNAEEDWAFHRIELLFEAIRLSTPFTAECFGIYGHSAGAQFVHRLVLFHPEASFDVAVAANAGWYTLPCQETECPYGVADAPVASSNLARALEQRLVILLGEEDVDQGHHSLRRTPEALDQGTHRLERGRFFLETGKEAAKRLGVEFGWRIETVAGAAHNDREMSATALRFLT